MGHQPTFHGNLIDKAFLELDSCHDGTILGKVLHHCDIVSFECIYNYILWLFYVPYLVCL